MFKKISKFRVVPFILFTIYSLQSSIAFGFGFPVKNDAHVFEVEDATVMGVAQVYEDQSAFGAKGVAYIYEQGAGFKINHVPKSKYIAMRYSSNFSGSVSVYINGESAGKIDFETTGAWVTNYNFVTISRDIEDNSVFEIRFNEGDTALNVDQMIFSDSLLDLKKLIYAELLMDKVANGANENPIGTQNSSGIYKNIEENNDDFESDELTWNILNPQKLHKSEIEDGKLVLWSTPYSAWLDKMRGVQLHKLIREDNFAVTADLEVTNLEGNALIGSTMPWTQAGIMIRKEDEDNLAVFYHGSMGLSNTEGLKAEYKNTIKDVSVWEFLDWDHSHSEIRLCRFDNEITMLLRPIGGEWVVVNKSKREDMAGKVYVGPVIYSHNPEPDIVAHIDYIEFKTLNDASDCMK